jgi:hypothetical protein
MDVSGAGAAVQATATAIRAPLKPAPMAPTRPEAMATTMTRIGRDHRRYVMADLADGALWGDGWKSDQPNGDG